MKCEIKSIDNKTIGDIELASEIFGLPTREDILARMVHWQLAKRRAGTHKTKGVSEVSGTTKKPWKQKGTGRARQGSLRSAQFRGGGVIFGPIVRSHAYDLPKKVRRLALKTALSAKFSEGKLLILDTLQVKSHKTKEILSKIKALGLTSALVIDGETVDQNFSRAASNLVGIDVLAQQGINVYDILRRDILVLTKDSVKYLEQRLR
ncbi:50S ribosomal protein L4 [Candidatus Nucleicultrix amoebiphila]|jgi:large subunit ribosomal protein L4|uniref:Large ribosomal subunit protein uL4 n=1 Tax=Candidatus Nucleicultrix amoebiphila FS5 TaxID=1414854 RepID=A0A1W6N669_9PROT|nr:50S ribosomal protein L4 [Candidatus Nucleicultrix amoebiphila]ARN85323.1 50S ribosomal protein L4 [Candidatus Nucleicultrix amoebiphila FS5]